MSSNSTASSGSKRNLVIAAACVAAVLIASAVGYAGLSRHEEAPTDPDLGLAGKVQKDVVRIAPDQLAAFNVGSPGTREFDNVRHTLGSIDFNQDKTTRVYSPYQGRVSKVLVKAGDDVKAGQTLYTVAVPDMSQAASALISAAAALRNADATLKRAQVLSQDSSIPQKEYQQAQADQQTAKAAYDAARQNLHLFDMSDADIKKLESDHRIGVDFSVKSPINGRITARAAQPGQLVQPGTDPAPMVVSDMRSLWMVANAPESDFRYFQVGQAVNVHVSAWPGRTFSGKISYVSDSMDADSRRFVVRAEIPDPDHVLRPQMSADFQIVVGAPENTLAVPAEAVVRESNGTDVVWVASGKDAKGPLFTRRTVQRGKTAGGWVQIEKGLNANEHLAGQNALFLSSLYETNAE